MNTSTPFTNKSYAFGDGGNYQIRPIQADDRERIIELFNHLSPESRYLRFAHAISKLPDDFLDDILHLDYKKEMALLAVITSQTGTEEIIGIARYVTPPNQHACEFSLSVSDSQTTQGVGTHLMLDLIEYAKKNGLQEMIGYVLSKNSRMLHLVSDLGFQIHSQDDDPDFKTVRLPL
ncbi:GNAT family N-acetyltransferase [Polynucleobacter sp. AP-Sving-400A-A2]|uniref:GNAT family N-acetyltransferase n=1 Tax=Polynucleobacter sp. AP-Sving-400A-A2 TaxID=2081049 RepID=UPI001BFE9657|nr:GNAT family N-acetyltransferase [Polynucleobacter sp. AP-Sving-400A-A2]QWE14922.1 GNAT family N-acetyltransferase [Polynucleobacter sp. AP-Sving-400A-A2]